VKIGKNQRDCGAMLLLVKQEIAYRRKSLLLPFEMGIKIS